MTERGSTPGRLALLIALSAAGILLRFAVLDRSYWFDELATLRTIDVPLWKTMLMVTAHDNQPPLYNITIFVWTQLFGFSEVAVRSLSLLYGLLALLTPWLARTSLSRSEKLLIFTILCVMPLPIRYAQEARNYSLLFLLSAACLFLYYEIIATRNRRLLPLLYVSLVLLAFSHLFGLMLAVSFLAVMFWYERRATWRLGLVAAAAALSAAIIIPLLHGGSGQLTGGNFWITFSAASLCLQLLMVFTPVGIALLAYALILWRRARDPLPFDPALAQVLLPFALMLIGSIVISLNTPILTDRNLIGMVAAFALLTGWLLQRVMSRSPVTLLALLCLLLLQSVALTWSPFLYIQQDFRSIAQHSIAANSKVCYVADFGRTNILPVHIFDFYVTRLLNHPELEPDIVAPSQLPQDLTTHQCGLWSAATLQKRGVSYLKTFPQFARCTDVPLGKPGTRMASELLACKR